LLAAILVPAVAGTAAPSSSHSNNGHGHHGQGQSQNHPENHGNSASHQRHSNGAGHSTGSSHSNGAGHSNGSSHSNGAGHSNGSSHSNGAGHSGDPGVKGDHATTSGSNGSPGNNGHVFINGSAIESHTVPHVDCTLILNFIGFDGDQLVDYRLSGWAPTGGGTFESGSVTLVDGHGTVSIDLSDDFAGVPPHPKQGFHVRLDVTTHEPGDQKHKVFWVHCMPAPLPSVTPTVDETETPAATPTDTPSETPTVGSTEIPTPSPTDSPSVLGEVIHRPSSNGSVLGETIQRAENNLATLPFTGSAVVPFVILALLVIVAGTAILAFRRRA
ncbi:MAG TPA: hypothetical protein VFK89_02290, partial [Actinomycetota bacterium]|nr:hypothetical protein [Actinomycetota bacterium]